MAIKKKVRLSYDGESYEPDITMGVIERIDDEVNILSFVQSFAINPSVVKVSKMFWVLLREAGADVSFQEVYDNGSTDTGELFSVAGEVMPLLMPNFAGQTQKKTKRKKKK